MTLPYRCMALNSQYLHQKACRREKRDDEVGIKTTAVMKMVLEEVENEPQLQHPISTPEKLALWQRFK